jgi:hypothetical protein
MCRDGPDGLAATRLPLRGTPAQNRVTVALQQATGSFALAFLCIPAFMIAMAICVWLSVPEHAGKELNAIIV